MSYRSTLSQFLATILVACGLALGSASIASGEATQPEQPTSAANEDNAPVQQQDEELIQDEEDRLPYRLLAIPEYVWEGLTYPIKEFAIFYEKVDLMNRTMDLFYFNEERTIGVFPKISAGGDFSTGIGFTAFNNNLFDKDKRVSLSYLFGEQANQSGELSYFDPSIFGSEFTLDTGLTGFNFKNANFFAGGNAAREEDETDFEIDLFAWDATLSRPIIGDFSGSFLSRVSIAEAQPDRGTLAPTTPGLNDTIAAVEVGPGIHYDTRDNPFRPSKGVYMESAFTLTEQINGDDFRYMGYRVDLQHYIPLFRGNRVLVLRGYLAKQHALNDRAIPFYELNLLDLQHGMRGFEEGRWQDEGALLFNIEWRYPIWEHIEGSLFIDEGQVFNDYSDLNTRTFRTSIGAGFRFVTPRNLAFRLSVAGSEDGIVALFGTDLEFLKKRSLSVSGSRF